MSVTSAVARNPKIEDAFLCGQELARSALAQVAQPACGLLFSPYKGIDHARLSAGIHAAWTGGPIVGGTTYGAIHGAKLEEESVLLMALGGDLAAAAGIGKGMGKDAFAAGRQAALQALNGLNGARPRVFIMFHEPQMGQGWRLVEGAQSVLGKDFPILGGGTGTGMIMEQSPLSKQFLGTKVYSGTCTGLLLAGDFSLALGSSNGAKRVTEAFTLTKAQDNVLVEFDGKPALDVMEKALGVEYGSCGVALSAFYITCGMIESDDESFTVMGLWGASCKKRVLYCGTPIQQGARYCFVKSNPESILEDTRLSVQAAVASLGGRTPRAAVCFDCYGRKLQLGAHGLIDQELRHILDALSPAPLAGMYSGSEIIAHKGRPSRYAHGTTVFAILADK